MGLFDKLKKKVLGQEENSAQVVTNEPANAPEIPSAPQQAPAMPTSKIEKEDFSGLSDLQILEKIDQYANEMKRTPNKMVYTKLSNSVNELDSRISAMPLSKRGAIAQDFSFIKAHMKNIELGMQRPDTNFLSMILEQVSGLVSKIYTELCK